MEDLQEIIAYFQEHERMLLAVIVNLKAEVKKLKADAESAAPSQETPTNSEAI